MSFVDEQMNIKQMDMMVGGSGDYPQRMLEQTYGTNAPLAFLKGRLKFGQGGQATADPMPMMEAGGEMQTPSV